jgi:hypothetical protein
VAVKESQRNDGELRHDIERNQPIAIGRKGPAGRWRGQAIGGCGKRLDYPSNIPGSQLDVAPAPYLAADRPGVHKIDKHDPLPVVGKSGKR